MRPLPSRNKRSVPTDRDFDLLEALFKKPLPDSYKEFLRSNNNVWLPDENEETTFPDQEPICISQFYDAIGRAGQLPKVVEINRDYGRRLPAETITIGGDAFGRQILLVVEGEETGMILLWDHYHEGFEEPPPDPYHNVYELAPDFEIFAEAIGRGPSVG